MQETKDFIGIRILPSQRDILDKLSKATGQSISELIREAITVYIYSLYNRLKAEGKIDD